MDSITAPSSPRLPVHSPRFRRVGEIVESLVFGLESILVLRIILELIGSRDGIFNIFVNAITDIVIYPFQGLLPSVQIGSSVWDSAAFLALVAIPILAGFLTLIIDWIRFSRSTPPSQIAQF